MWKYQIAIDIVPKYIFLINNKSIENVSTLLILCYKVIWKFLKSKEMRPVETLWTTIKSNLIINLASNEYSKVIDFKALNCDVVAPVFKDANKKLAKIYFSLKGLQGMEFKQTGEFRSTYPHNYKLRNYKAWHRAKAHRQPTTMQH